MYFSCDHLKLRYDPFPICLARPLMDNSLYRELLENYPDTELFGSHADYGKAGVKYVLTGKLGPKNTTGISRPTRCGGTSMRGSRGQLRRGYVNGIEGTRYRPRV